MAFRDDLSFTKVHYLMRSRNGQPPTVAGSPERQVTRTFRDQATPTTPVGNGVFVHPTDYKATFMFTSTSGGFTKWKKKSPYGERYDSNYLDTWDGWTDRGYWNWGLTSVTLIPATSNQAISEARSKVLSSIRNNDFNVGQSIGEARETMNTIVGLLRAGYGLISRNPELASKGLSQFWGSSPKSAKKAARAGSAAARGYLSFMYGIKPIMNDIYSLLEVIENGLGSGEVASVEATALDSSYGLPPKPNLSYEITFSGKAERGCKVGASIMLKNPATYQLWRYGLTNPLSLAWELTPLSFVVDWFLNIGGFIDALQRPMGVSFAHGYETLFLDNRFTVKEQIHPTPTSTNRIEVIVPGYAETVVSCKSMQRYVLPWILPPLPYLKLELNTSQALSALALLTNAITK